MTAPRYITPLQQAVLAWPAAVRPEELGPPRVLSLTKTGTGSGSLLVQGASFDEHFVRVEIVLGGEPGVATYRARTDGASSAAGTWGDTLLTSTTDQALLHTGADEITAGADTGLRLAFVAGTPTPSFVAGDRWDFTTRAMTKVLAACAAASARAKALISGDDGGGQFTGELTNLDAGLKRDVAILGRRQLLEDRGFDPKSQDGALYLQGEREAEARLIEVGAKLRFPQVTEAEEQAMPVGHKGMDFGGIAKRHRSGYRNGRVG